MVEQVDSDVFVNSITVTGGEFNLSSALEQVGREAIAGKVQGVQIASSSDEPLKPLLLGELANSAFGIFPPECVDLRNSPFTGRDYELAQEFEYVLLPNFACLRIVSPESLEAWTGPVLVSKNHPLANLKDISAVVSTDQFGMQSIIEPQVLNPDELVHRWYIRLAVLDKPLVLANIAQAIGDAGINIQAVRQPGGDTFAEIALILSPCSGKVLGKVTETITNLLIGSDKLCQGVNTVLPII